MANKFVFAPAKRENVKVIVGLAGASGSGKTMSALRLAQGLSPSGKIAFIDTEARRGLHYADKFSFLHAEMNPPFKPERFVEAMRAAEDAGVEVIIFDSFSHEYDGEGGIIQWADDLAKGNTKPPSNWIIPKEAHKRMVNAMLQSRAHLIFCMRADEKISIEKREVNGHTKTVIVPLGWVPICEKRFMYELTVSFTLTPERPGVPVLTLPHKLQEQHRHIFKEGTFIDEAAGTALAAWASGGEIPKDPIETLRENGAYEATRGSAPLGSWWKEALTAQQRRALASDLPGWKETAAKVDAEFAQSDTQEEGQ